MIGIEAIRHALASASPMSPADHQAKRAIDAQCTGWSGEPHFVYFRTLLEEFPIKSILMIGVYCGRDIAYLSYIAQQLGRDIEITGVDKFSDDACADWPEEKRDMNWQEAGFGPSPDVDRTRANLVTLGYDNVELIKADDAQFMASTDRRFDFVYIDTSHDEDTVRKQIPVAKKLTTELGLVGGDDYSDKGTWGVISAIKGTCADHAVFADWCWITTADLIG